MATRQYIGARYVPKFADPIVWNKDTTYEALTIVTYLNNSYTSKKPVPLGIDIKNEEYWVLTGNYNSQVEQYRKDVEQLSGEVEQLDAGLSDAQNRLTNVEKMTTKRRYIFVSDSYADNSAGALNYDGKTWVEFCCDKLKKTIGIDAFKLYKAGSGFTVGNNTFLNVLQNGESQISEPSTITDIVICGGCNDKGAPETGISSALSSIKEYAKTTYPNANISVGCIGWFNTNDFDFLTASYTQDYYKSACINNACTYLNGVENILHLYTLFGNGHHPNIDGSQKIGSGVADALMHGSCDVSYACNPTPTWSPWIKSSDITVGFIGSLLNGSTKLAMYFVGGNTVTFNTDSTTIVPIPTNGMPICTLNNNNVLKGDSYTCNIPCTIRFETTSSTYVYLSGRLGLTNGQIVFYPDGYESSGAANNITFRAFRIITGVTFNSLTKLG